jgi:hypothetical protein
MQQRILRALGQFTAANIYIPLTEALFAEESISIFESSRTPSGFVEVITEKFQHHSLFFMPCRLFPEPMDQFNFAQSEVEKRTLRGIAIVTHHVLVACYHLQVCFLESGASMIKKQSVTKRKEIPSIPQI